jgi:signal transduction histidine kinase
MKRSSLILWHWIIRKPTLAVLAACLVLILYIGFLVASNVQNQAALHQSSLRGFQLDLEKRAASLGYFFSERKYDLRSMVASTEVMSYFINKSLGMSEQYGLKVNLFVIHRLFRTTLQEKSIQGDGIYDRLLLVDRVGAHLVDTKEASKGGETIPVQGPPANHVKDPSVFIDQSGDSIQIVLRGPCILKNAYHGELLAWLNLETLFKHFIGNAASFNVKGFKLVSDDGRTICLGGHRFISLSPDVVQRIETGRFSKFNSLSGGRPAHKLLITRADIHKTPVSLIAWVKNDAAFGVLAPWQLLVGTGSLSLVILLGIVVLMRFKAQHAMLEDQFKASEQQQAMLSQKHQQLKDEIEKRQAAEKELEAQRTLSMRSDRLRSLGEMAAGIAHELNQPLTGVRGLAEVLLIQTEAGREIPSEKLLKNTRRIIEQADRMVHIINHVRMFAREAGKLQTQPVDLNDIAYSGVSLIEAQLKSHGLSLVKQFPPDALMVDVNPYSVEEVIINLINNARDAVEKKKTVNGGDFRPRLGIATWAESNRDGAHVCLKVSDNGQGIPEAISGKVFDPFFTSKDPDKGTGLGLSICKSIVEEFGGQIHFQSVENEGTDFTIRFPGYAKNKDSACA